MWPEEKQQRLREAALEWLSVRTHDGLYPLTHEDIAEFGFEGERFRLMDPQRGIRKPAVFSSALSIRTVWRPTGADRPYDDEVGAHGLMVYKWRGDDPDHAENRALRAAMDATAPLIWFWGVGPGLYQVVFPVYLVGEDRSRQEFTVATDGLQHLRPTERPVEEVLRRYFLSQTVQRLHQPVFRAMVMRAYENTCAVCSLRHPVLLDAAHIVEDKHPEGIAAVTNGLALCKIHHASYDAGIVGVRPDLVIEVRSDILDEVDGPLLEHGIKGLHGQRLRMVPRSRREQPSEALLAMHYERFRATA